MDHMDHMDHHHHHGNMDMAGNVTEEVFCLGDGQVMNNGFQIAIGSAQPCALFLFPGWVVDTPAKYFGACFAAFLMPTVIVLIQILREKVLESSKNSSRTFGLDALAAAWYGLQMMFAYFLMLLAMLFETGIFLCICFGFVASFLLLQRYKRYKGVTGEKVAMDGAPCCAL
ncbi:unnamed protein product [Cladocopium goreaui]|uniref:Copper transport protein n=1 Tax=Cladocopium goreaui TaxID=2562237 RepID=A0A9P1GM76_9DINO|nr:unnamed protein product [Cladocopium goreaui]